MQRKISLLAVCLSGILLGSSAYASQAFNGWFAGVGLGISQLHAKQDINITSTSNSANDVTTGISTTANQPSNAVTGKFDLGYGRTWNKLYLGAEAYVSIANHSINTGSQSDAIYPLYGPAYNTDLTNNYKVSPLTAGILLRPGYVVAPNTLVYLNLGAKLAKIRWDSSLYGYQDYYNEGIYPNINDSVSKTRLAYQIGLGMERYISTNVTLDLDYIYTNYGHLSTNNSVANTENAGALTNNSQVSLTDSTVTLGLNYYFDHMNSLSDSGSNALNPNWNGFYAGAALGGSSLTANQSISNSAYSGYEDVVNPITSSQSLTANRLGGNLFVGYGHAWQNWYLALEGFANIGGGNVSSNDANWVTVSGDNTVYQLNSANSNIKVKPLAFGVDLRPGYLITPSTLIFAKAGVEIARLSWDMNVLNAGSDNSEGNDFWSQPLNLSSRVTRAAYQLGFGLEQYVTTNLSMRLEYTFTDYGRLALNGSAAGVDNNENAVTTNNSSHAHLYDNTIMLGLSYHFGR